VTPRSPRIGSSTHLRDSGQLLRTDVMPGVRLAPAARTRNPGRESPGRLAWIGNSKGPFRTANFAERAETLAALTQGAALPAASVPAGKHHQHGNQISRGCAGGVRATSDASSGRDLSPAVLLQMRQDARYDRELFDAGIDPELATAARAAFDLDSEHALEPACLVHCHVSGRRGLLCFA
jgi:hypothetical protein